MAAHRYTPAMVERLRLLSKCGHGAAGIARHLQQMTDLPITPLSVRVKASALGLSLRPPKGHSEVRTPVSPDAWRALRAEAARRGVSVARLCRVLLETIARDDLSAAVLDAAPERVAPERRPSETELAAGWRAGWRMTELAT